MIEEYIEYSEGYIRAYTRERFLPTDPRFKNAQGCATYMAALCAVIRPLGGATDGVDYRIDEINIKKSTQGKMRLSTADKFSKQGKMYLDALSVDVSDVPESNTGRWGI